jgi:hypothetical protein
MAFNKVIEDACRYAPVREYNSPDSTCHLGTEALVYLKQLVFPLGNYDSNAIKKICSSGLVLQQKCMVNLIYGNVFNKVRKAWGNLLAYKNEILFRRMTSNAT